MNSISRTGSCGRYVVTHPHLSLAMNICRHFSVLWCEYKNCIASATAWKSVFYKSRSTHLHMANISTSFRCIFQGHKLTEGLIAVVITHHNPTMWKCPVITVVREIYCEINGSCKSNYCKSTPESCWHHSDILPLFYCEFTL